MSIINIVVNFTHNSFNYNYILEYIQIWITVIHMISINSFFKTNSKINGNTLQ